MNLSYDAIKRPSSENLIVDPDFTCDYLMLVKYMRLVTNLNLVNKFDLLSMTSNAFYLMLIYNNVKSNFT